VVRAGVSQQTQVILAQWQQGSGQRLQESGCTVTMFRIPTIILPLDIMQICKELHYPDIGTSFFCQAQTIGSDPDPV
jgi:hypothetical protein